MNYLIAVYVIAFGIIFLYLLLLDKRQNKLIKEIKIVKDFVSNKK